MKCICTFPVADLFLMLDGFLKAQSVQNVNEFFYKIRFADLYYQCPWPKIIGYVSSHTDILTLTKLAWLLVRTCIMKWKSRTCKLINLHRKYIQTHEDFFFNSEKDTVPKWIYSHKNPNSTFWMTFSKCLAVFLLITPKIKFLLASMK